MAILLGGKNYFFSRLKSSNLLQRFKQTLIEGGSDAHFCPEMETYFTVPSVDKSKWKKWDSRTYGIKRSMIPGYSWLVLNILKNKGFEAYLVGGCVRDLLLKKVPKDFDVITTASLKQIKKQFHQALIVGRRFPICRVRIRGFIVEVSSFDTVAENTTRKDDFPLSQMSRGCDEKDFIRWKNSMHRDFTINSLFFDPFSNKIYDYTNGMGDLKSLKLQTLGPAHLSFKEDCARILRGLRIAARLGLSLSKDIETAMHDLSSSIESLGQFRIMMELNYMLSYGAAEPSINLLCRFNLLGTFLPIHAAYLDQQAGKKSVVSSTMLMKLFFNMDKLISCDQPADCRLWIGLLAFHLALVNNPQNAHVVWALAFLLYHGKWMEAVNSASKHTKLQVKFVPEILGSSEIISEDELAEEVTHLVSLVLDSVHALVETDSLLEMMSRFPAFPCSGLVVVPKKAGKDVAQIFDVLVRDIKSYKDEREDLIVNPYLLGRGDPAEIRFTLGHIILETMKGESTIGGVEAVDSLIKVYEENCSLTLSDMVKNQVVAKEKRRRSSVPEPKQQMEKKQKVAQDKLAHSDKVIVPRNQEMLVKEENGEKAGKQQKIAETCQPPRKVQILIEKIKEENCCVIKQEPTVKTVEAVENDSAKEENAKHNILQHKETKEELVVDEDFNLSLDKRENCIEKTSCHSASEVVVKKKAQGSAKEKGGLRLLSSFFK